jgi:hypothetical protein
MNTIKHFAKLTGLRMEAKAEALVNAWISLTEKYTAKKVQSYVPDHEARKHFSLSSDNLSEYEKDSAEFNELFMKYCVEGTVFEWTDLDMVKNPQVRNRDFMDRFFAVVSQVMTPVIPAVVSTAIMNLAEVKDIALGDTAQFIVKSNELFQVNEFGEGIHMGATQRLYNEEVVVNPTLKEITVDVDWYWVATGKMDFGEWAYKVGVSFGAYINKLIYSTMVSSITDIPAAYKANSFSDANFLNISQRVEAANAGAKCYVYGTKTALGSILPSNSYMQVLLGEEWSKVGYIAQYKSVPVMEIDQILVPGTVNGAATFGIDNTYLWFMPMGGYKPVKLVFEGAAWTTQDDSTKTSDKTQNLVIQRRMGVKLIVGSRYGSITLP